jgi:hypothetical protein
MAPEEVIQYLTGEQIVGGDADEDGIRIYTQNGLVLFMFGLGIMRADDKVTH